MSTCQNCQSDKLAQISAKCSDMFFIQVDNEELRDYVPYNIGIGGGDYVKFTYCLNCGQIQNLDEKFPVPQETIDEIFCSVDWANEDDLEKSLKGLRQDLGINE